MLGIVSHTCLVFCKFSALLERVFLRVGSAESDEQLQSAISKFLPPVLLKLSSQQDGVRKKVHKSHYTSG
jgi:hypothetical protein